MAFDRLAWLFAVAVSVHNLEEAVWLPKWSASCGRWHRPVAAGPFRFTVAALTLAAWAAVFLAVLGGRESIGAYLTAGYALAMLLNVVFPHLLAVVVLRRYAPGIATALVLNLPVTLLLLQKAFADGFVSPSRFVWVGPLVVAGILGLIPAMLILGRRMTGWAVKTAGGRRSGEQ